MVLSTWRFDYNTVRPHSKLGGTPAEFAWQHGFGHAQNYVAITSTINHERAGLYS